MGQKSIWPKKVENEFMELAMFELSLDIKVGILQEEKNLPEEKNYGMAKNSSSVLFMSRLFHWKKANPTKANSRNRERLILKRHKILSENSIQKVS